MSGAPKKNLNSAKGKEFSLSLKRALAHHYEKQRKKGTDLGRPDWRKGLDLITRKYVENAIEGESQLIRDIADRIDGKPNQTVEVTTYDGITDEDIDARIDQIFADRTEARSVEAVGTEGTEPEGTVH